MIKVITLTEQTNLTRASWLVFTRSLVQNSAGSQTILRFVVIFLGTSRNILGLYLKLHDKRFMSHVHWTENYIIISCSKLCLHAVMLTVHKAAKVLLSSLTFTFPTAQETHDTVRGRRSRTFVKHIVCVLHLSVNCHCPRHEVGLEVMWIFLCKHPIKIQLWQISLTSDYFLIFLPRVQLWTHLHHVCSCGHIYITI